MNFQSGKGPSLWLWKPMDGLQLYWWHHAHCPHHWDNGATWLSCQHVPLSLVPDVSVTRAQCGHRYWPPQHPGHLRHNWDWSLSLTAQNKLSNLIQTILWSVICSAINGNISQMYWVHIFKNLYILETTAMCNQFSVSYRMVVKKSFKILNRF